MTNLPQFDCKEGTMAFIVPFSFEPIEGVKNDFCSEKFQEIENECYGEEKQNKQLKEKYQDEEALKILYEESLLSTKN